MRKELLIIDDDSDHVLVLSRALKSLLPQISISGTSQISKAQEVIKENSPGVIILDLSLTSDGPSSGLSLLSEIIEIAPLTRVIVLTGHSTSEFGMQAIERGAHAFIGKPAEPAQLKILIEDAFNNFALRDELQRLKTKSHQDLLIGDSDLIKKAKDEIIFAASTSQPVLITGETGTGKGIAALLIHKQSIRNSKSFIRYQPSIGSSELTFSELFGAKKGSYTGAIEDRKGLVSLAHGGTFFLDEVGELPSQIQVTFLGVLQEKTFKPLGETKEEVSDFRLISATNRSLDEAVTQGSFRLDLLHRINHHHIVLPPLREITSDIPVIASHILEGLCTEEGISRIEITTDALTALKSYNWPGNVRELEAVIKRAAHKASFENRINISKEDLKFSLLSSGGSSKKSFSEQVEDFKISLINKALQEAGGNQVQASKLLELDRSSMRRILARSGE